MMLESFRYGLQGCGETERDVYGLICLTPWSQLAPNAIPSIFIHKSSPTERVLKSLQTVQCFISSYIF